MSETVETERPVQADVIAPQPGGAVARAPGRRLAPLAPSFEVQDRAKGNRFRLFGAFGLLLGFIGIVVVPTLASGYYFFFVASDVFVSEAKFAVRGTTEKLPTSSSNVSMVPSTITSLNSNQDAYIVQNYIGSLPMIERLEKEEGLRSLFSRNTVDTISRLSGNAPVEIVRHYWNRMVSASVDSLSGVVNLEVRAFAPQDSLALARAIVAASEELVNELSRRKRADALKFANEEVSRAETRVKDSVAAMQAFRNETGLLDPVKSAEAVSKLLASLRTDQIELSNELATSRRTLSENSPSVQVLATRLEALTSQIRTVERELTSPDGKPGDRSASRALSLYEGLMLEREFAEKFYTTMLTMAETARAEADRQQLYLITFVEPALAQMALFPRRGASVLVVLACSIAIWSIVSLLVAAVRDHDA